jgi:hypothetical protein
MLKGLKRTNQQLKKTELQLRKKTSCMHFFMHGSLKGF